MRMRLLLPVGVVVLSMLGLSEPASATGGEGEAWPSFTESSSCGAQRVTTPHAEDPGWMAGGELLRGEFAAMFGRTVDQVRSSLVPWEVPGSSEVLTIHARAVPAFERAASNLEASLAAGAEYRIDPESTFAAAARTIGGNTRISRHTFGIAIDVNARSNPHRSDNTLVTDLPE
ncbi:MAG: M15 family metallopeptidase [Acidimicrobiia bacterium]